MDWREINYVLNPFVGDKQTLHTTLPEDECTNRLNEIIECTDRDHPTRPFTGRVVDRCFLLYQSNMVEHTLRNRQMFIVGIMRQDQSGTRITVIFLPTFANIALVIMFCLAIVFPDLREMGSNYASTCTLAYLFFVTYQLSTRRFRRTILDVLHEKLQATNSIVQRWHNEGDLPI